MSNLIEQLDEFLARGLSGWNGYSILLLFLILCVLTYPAFFVPEPDIHPILLARQAIASNIRHYGESATYRSLDAPFGYPLKKGLDVRTQGQAKWTAGKQGDLRDIFEHASGWSVNADGRSVQRPSSKIFAVFGHEKIDRFEAESLRSDIYTVGKSLQDKKCSRIAIYLSNSTEFLISLLACAYFGLEPILIPPRQPFDRLSKILRKSGADVLILSAGSAAIADIKDNVDTLRQIVVVVAPSSQHVDWASSFNSCDKVHVSVWHELITNSNSSPESLTRDLANGLVPDLVFIRNNQDDSPSLFKVSQKSLMAAIGAQVAVLPHSYSSTSNHQFSSKDLLLPLVSLTHQYTLTVILAAFFAGASVAVTSATGPQVPYESAFLGVSPTILVAHPQTLLAHIEKQKSRPLGLISQVWAWSRFQTILKGSMPRLLTALGETRLIYTFWDNDQGQANVGLSAMDLINLRLQTGTRVIYSFLDSSIAGALSQTNLVDYQNGGLPLDHQSHFGPPLGCLEVKLKVSGKGDIDECHPTGKIVVTGPAIHNGRITLNSSMHLTSNNTLAIARE